MMTRELERRLAEATEMAKKQRHEFVTLEHILYSLTQSPRSVEILEACGVKTPELKKDLLTYLENNTPEITEDQLESYGGYESWTPEFTLACHRLIQRSALQMKSAGKNQITEGNLLVSFFYEQDSHAVFSLSKQGISQFDIINFISHGIQKDPEFGDAEDQVKKRIRWPTR